MNEIITVYSAELMRRLRSRVFWIGLCFGLLGIAAMMKLPQFLVTTLEQNARAVALAGDPALIERAKPLLQKDFKVTGTLPGVTVPKESDLSGTRAGAIAMLGRDAHALRVTVYAKDPSNFSTASFRRDLLPLNVQLATHLTQAQAQSMLAIAVDVRTIASKFGTASAADSARGIAYVLLVFLYILIVLNSQLILTSVAEEKTSRIAELLVASVDPTVLLIAKIASSATLALLQMGSWIGLALLLGAQPGASGMAAGSPEAHSMPISLDGISSADITSFLTFFALGYLEMATLFAAVGSMINRTEDLGSLSGPLFLPVIAAFFIAMLALGVPDSPIVGIASFIPVVSPFVMFARVVVSDVPAWQIAISIALNLAAICIIAMAAGKIYRIGMLLYGRPPKFSQIFAVLRS